MHKTMADINNWY